MSSVELYDFHTPAQHWRYTSGLKKVTFGGNDYLPAQITRERWDQSLKSENLKLTSKGDMMPIALFGAGNPSHIITLDIMTLAGAILYTGTVDGVEFDEKAGMAKGTIALINLLLKGVMGREYSPACGWRLGTAQGSRCGVDLTDPKFSVTIDVATAVITSRSITHPKLADDGAGNLYPDTWFAKGKATKNGESLYVLSHVGTTIYTLSSFILAGGTDIVIEAGCFHTQTACGPAKFNNLPNYGGYPVIPQKNPVVDRIGGAFGGTP